MLAVLAWNNVRRQKTAFAAVSLAVVLVGGSGLLLISADTVREAGHPDMDTVVSLLALMAVLSGLVSIFVVSGTLSFHVMQQRRQWGLLRTIGMTPAQVRRVVTAEAMVVAVMATVAGSVLAVLYGQSLAAVLVATGLAPPGFHLRVTFGPFVWSAAVGLIVTMVAATSASRKASRVAPLEVLQEVAAQARLLSRSRATVGALALAGGVVLLFLATEYGGERGMGLALGGAVSLCAAGSALGPVLLRAMAWAVGAPLAALDPGPGELARAAVLTQPRRATSTASPIMLTIALACTFLFAVATSDAASGIQRTGPDAWGLPVLIGSAVIYTAISVLNSSAMSMGNRADELRLLRAAGITPAQLTRAICWESAIVTCSGALLGTGIAAASLVALSLAGTGTAGFVYSGPQYLAVLGLCAVSGLAGSLLSTRRARRGPLVAG